MSFAGFDNLRPRVKHSDGRPHCFGNWNAGEKTWMAVSCGMCVDRAECHARTFGTNKLDKVIEIMDKAK